MMSFFGYIILLYYFYALGLYTFFFYFSWFTIDKFPENLTGWPNLLLKVNQSDLSAKHHKNVNHSKAKFLYLFTLFTENNTSVGSVPRLASNQADKSPTKRQEPIFAEGEMELNLGNQHHRPRLCYR